MTITIDKRLQGIAKMVDKCDAVADIGTDHGLLPCYLVNKKITKKAYACDILEQPLQNAKDNIIKFSLQEKVIPLLNDGLKNFSFPVDTIIIAGMGGYLISKILYEAQKKYNCLILQPNNNSLELRKMLVSLNYKIVDESVLLVKGKYYDVIKAIDSDIPVIYNTIQLKYGPINIKKKEFDFISKLIYLKKVYLNIKSNCLPDSKDYHTIEETIQELDSLINN